LEQILKYFKNLENGQIQSFTLLGKIYRDWNEKINIISRKDIDHLYEKHILHSLSISKIIKFNKGTTVLDVGTGGGFPGIPLAIMFSEVKFLLIDSIGKKIKVVQDIIAQLNLKNVEARHIHSNDIKQKFDFIVSRAVTAFPEFVKLVEGKIKKENQNSLPNGILYLKGGDLTEEIKEYKNGITLYPISDFYTEEFFTTKFILFYPL
jgi:16S rRNA (guanine527-N7)-methyltransferase